MFERYLSDALTTYFGSFVENLDADKVRLSAWKGELVLSNLTIRQNSLDLLVGNDCPVEIAYGAIGNLELKIPWKSVLKWSSERTASSATNVECSVILSDVHILITPKTRRRKRTKDDDELSAEEQRVKKEHDVQRLLDSQLFERVAKSTTTEQQSSSSRWQWVRELFKNLLSNLSVTVRDIHVRYEDAGMGFTTRQARHVVREAFAVGVTLRQFSVQTMDPTIIEASASQEQKDSDEQEDKSDREQMDDAEDEERLPYSIRHKRAAAYQLAVYWDRGKGRHLMISNVQNTEDDILQLDSMDSLKSESRTEQDEYFSQAFQVLHGGESEEFRHRHLYDVEHTYVLSPVSPSMEFELVSENATEDETASKESEARTLLVPPSTVDMSFPPCCLTISANTLEDTAYLRKSLAIWGRTRKISISEASVRRLTGLRPSTSALEDPRSWWRYAVEATLVLERRDSSQSEHWRPRGWLGLARAITKRREYVRLYEKVLFAEDELKREAAHRDLIRLEDDLLVEEVVAFRLSVYSVITQRSPKPAAQNEPSTLSWSEWMRGKKENTTDIKPAISESSSESENLPMEDMGIIQLSLDHRRRMYLEMTKMLEREESNRKLEASFRLSNGVSLVDEDPNTNLVIWKTCMAFKELSVQVNERIISQRNSYRLRPVVRLSCAVIQRQTLYRNDSWEVDSAIASLQVVDLTGGTSVSLGRNFPVLVGRKSDSLATKDSHDSIEIDGAVYPLSASVSVRRTIEGDTDRTESGMDGAAMPKTITYTVVRLVPLEVVYSTIPVAALSRALSTAKTPELTDDYHRMLSVMTQWRNRQKGRFLRALAHKRKKIVVDVDIAAPVVLIPEDPNENDSPLLVVDLGRLRLSNTDERIEDDSDTDCDDKWKLSLDEIQVQSTSTSSYRMNRDLTLMARSHDSGSLGAQKLIEPFSVHFIISTRIASQQADADASNGTHVNIYATLPRLVFNLKSSAVRLVERLKLQWVQRSQTPVSPMASGSIQADRGRPNHAMYQPSSPSPRPDETGSKSRRIKFCFSAPLIGFRLENDVDGRGFASELNGSDFGLSPPDRSCPLVDLALRGIRGEFTQTVTSDTHSTSTFDARMRSVTAVDLYQKAGEDFALLLSSLPPSMFSGQLPTILEEPTREGAAVLPGEPEGSDLVAVRYVSSSTTNNVDSSSSKSIELHLQDTLAITFHELYVEWNPETIAAIHKGMMLPKDTGGVIASNLESDVSQSSDKEKAEEVDGVEQGGESDDEFYDAVAAVGISECSTWSPRGDEESDTQLISEISSRVSSFSDVAELTPQAGLSLSGTVNPSSPFFSDNAPLLIGGGGLNPLISSFASTPPRPVRDDVSEQLAGSDGATTTISSFEVTFKLSALRVNFNKDSRNRRIVTAEMDDTHVFYVSESSGVSNTKARIGNLCFTDPSSSNNTTLYKEILGLKSDSVGTSSAKASSLLEMELCINPRTRRVLASDEDLDNETGVPGVSIDCRNGTVCGADISVSLRLSPMRFVYFQQLWLEITDYFFEAIIGYEVWGKERSPFVLALSRTEHRGRQEHEGSRQQSSVLRSDLPGILAEEFSFTRFDVRMDEPVILLPVSYLSPHFLRLEFSSLAASNYYLGTVVDGDLSEERAQWYNNCDLELRNLRVTSWEGAEISGLQAQSNLESMSQVTDARIRFNWPTGKYALSIVPKWKVDCEIDRMILCLHKENYALLQHIIVHNIGELSRHLEEWDALQNLPPLELERYKKEVMVHFGYDKKDTAPSTYTVSVKVPSIKFFFLGSSGAGEDTVMEANCTSVEWQMRKLSDRISRQSVDCDIALTKPAGREGSRGMNAVDLLLPVDDSTRGAGVTTRELSYTSITQPAGDNVRTLEIVNACIFAIYPAWVNVKRFFSSLPEPDFMHAEEVGLAMQIGDRWYRIGSSTSTEAGSPKDASFSSSKGAPTNVGKVEETLPTYQFRLLLKSPRIVLLSESSKSKNNTCVVLRMDHFDFFHLNDGNSRKITKTFFVHDLGLYTSSSAVLSRDGYIDENSLIRPWCISGLYERCDSRILGPCDEHALCVKADVLQARAAYSDMSVAIDVGLRFLSDLEQQPQPRTIPRNGASSGSDLEKREQSDVAEESHQKLERPCKVPRKSLMVVELDGFELHVVDDTMRHFADSQQLIELSLEEISWYQVALQEDERDAKREKRVRMCLHRMDVFDFLQPMQSPFRLVATSRSPESETVSEVEASEMPLPRMCWADFQTVEDTCWGFSVSPFLAESVQSQGLSDFCDTDFFDSSSGDSFAQSDELEQRALGLVEIHHKCIHGVSDEYAVNLRPLTMQWNPSTVIALQRFLGRLHKEVKTKSSESEWLISSASSNTGVTSFTGSDAVPTRARVQIDHLTVFLNKEHQHRCLVRATLSDAEALFERDARTGMTVKGSIKDLSVWDADSYSNGPQAILKENRRVLSVMSAEEGEESEEAGFLRFLFKTFAGTGPLSSSDSLPLWVSSRLIGLGNSRSAIDDYLSVSMATVRVCYIRERTEEILDYLSNGLPGKGMGATSRAAKGFINKRIQTKSYFELNIRAPQVYVPQHEKTYRGILVRLGDVNARSWFDKASESEKTEAGAWYRVLSLSLTGLCWNANETNSFVKIDAESADAAPLDVNLGLRKPTRKGQAVVIKGSLSCIELTMTYTTYVLLKAIMRDNVSREIDVDRWDNVEKAYWLEEDGIEQPAYSSNARFIHYGQQHRKEAATLDRNPTRTTESTEECKEAPSSVPKLDCLFKLDGLRLKLRRNDRLEGLDTLSSKGSDIDSSFCYDIVVLRADAIEISLNANSAGDKSLQLSLRRLGVFDLGDYGRLARARYYQTLMELDSSTDGKEMNFHAMRNPCAFSVLVEGYSPSEDQLRAHENNGQEDAEPQLFLTVDTCSATSAGLVKEESISSAEDSSDKIVLARMVINYLSVNALIRPLREILAFLACSWSVQNKDGNNIPSTEAVPELGNEMGRSADQVEERTKPTSFRKGLQLKVVAHYPRIFFLADESDPCSRALVLRGLAVLDASIVDQETFVEPGSTRSDNWKYESSREFSDRKMVTAVNVQLHSMETYINPNVESALGLAGHNPDLFDQNRPSDGSGHVAQENSDDHLLGVALIEPVTAGIEFCQIRRIRFPTLESFSVNMEPVSTMLSFEDLTLLEAILERWSPRSSKASSISIEGSSSQLDVGRVSMGMASQSSFESAEVVDGDAQTESYDVTFETDQLGLVLKKVSGSVIVERIQNAERAESVQLGDEIIAVNGVAVGSPSLDEMVELLARSARPVRLSFSRKLPTYSSIWPISSSFGMSKSYSQDSETDASVGAVANEEFADDSGLPDVYTVTLRRGVLTGLTVEPSPCGGLPVVIDVLPSFFVQALSAVGGQNGSLEVTETLSARLPCTGAVVVEIDGKPSSEIGYLETKELLEGLSSKMTDADKLSIRMDSDTYSVKFLELESSEWGKIKTADIVITGIALTFIDDFKGRDMPLLRGKLDNVDVHVERGLGIDPRAVIAPPPDVVELSQYGVNSDDEVTMIRALLQMEVDYFHPRIAVWEPLLEPSDLCLLVEWQRGSVKRPGQLAVEASDRFLDSPETVEQTSELVTPPRVIGLNLTDAAAEVVVRLMKEWGDWRQRSLDQQEVDSQSLGLAESRAEDESISRPTNDAIPSSPTAQSESTIASFGMVPGSRFDASSSVVEARRVAAKKAAKAALVFAQKRGAGTKKKSESSKPFVFRNRTGMSLSFMQHGTYAEEQHDRPYGPRGMAPTFVADGSDARFHMDVVSHEQQLKDDGSNVKRVRAYDGQYPPLCVILEALPGITVEPLRNLPVYKVGNTISRLEVRKLCTDAEATQSTEAGVGPVGDAEFSVPVVWTVEIEDNRRILTLSSAVRVISSGVRLSLDVGVCTSSGDDNTVVREGGANIKEVGTAQSGSPFYLPLWVALRCESVDVFVKPTGLEYNWSSQSILSFVPTRSSDSDSLSILSVTDWVWKETFDSACAVPCEHSAGDNLSSKTVWLSCISLPRVGKRVRSKDSKRLRKSLSSQERSGALISIAVDAGLTIRNMLPVNLQWELGAFGGSEVLPINSSSSREQRDGTSHTSMREGYGLLSGEGVDILSFSPGLWDARARFRCYSDQEWSEWAQLAPCLEKSPSDIYPSDYPKQSFGRKMREVEYHGVSNVLDDSGGNEMLTTRQVNVQIKDEFGVPLTIGVRVVPKMAGVHGKDTEQCFGYDAIVFAELWLRNLTPLPLSFGCPSTQINKATRRENGLAFEPSSDEGGIINAEAALIEIASILEFGEKGKGFSLRDDNGSITIPNTYLLPYQTADLIYEEVFEYVEVENLEVKRRWWASETHDSTRQDPLLCNNVDHGWYWIDDEWKIDCSGQSIRSSDGAWESCRSLIGGKDDFFSTRRMFNPSHPFRRRRWFRRRKSRNSSVTEAQELLPGQLHEGINAFHQPINDAFSRAQEHAREIRKKKERAARNGQSDNIGDIAAFVDEGVTKISVKCADGQWSLPCVVPQTGTAHGVIRVPASRWPTLTKISGQQAAELPQVLGTHDSRAMASFDSVFTPACLGTDLYELCYKISDLGEDWGELSRLFLLTPRFMMRNDSQILSIEVKQSGAPDEKAVLLEPGDVAPFFWADFRLPELVCVRPVVDNHEGIRKYKWTGGFDVCSLGMTAIRVRRSRLHTASSRKTERPTLKSIRSLVEIRPGTGGTGINVSFKEEDPDGNGSLFRIENLSPFLIWIAQDGVLANPSAMLEERRARKSEGAQGGEFGRKTASLYAERRFSDEHAKMDGDLIEPGARTAFALDVPYRQGKYAGRKAATMSELTRIRVGLAPLASRDGVETTKVVSLSGVGESVRLSPAKLISISGFDIRTHLVDLRVLGVVTTDGPTRVLRFCMMRKNESSGVFDYTLSSIASAASFPNPNATSVKITTQGSDEYLQQVTLDSAMKAIEMDAPGENDATRLAFFGTSNEANENQDSSQSDNADNAGDDTLFSFRASFHGFSCSLIDNNPSEIALITLKDVSVSANWNKKRTTDGAALISVGWLQVDNYVPSAPFPVAVCPVTVKQKMEQMKTVDENQEDHETDEEGQPSPLMMVGLTFAPRHKSGILCLRSVTIAPRDLAVSVDIAFIVRLQQFLLGIHRHLRSASTKDNMSDRANASVMLLQTETRQFIPFPDIASTVQQLEGANAVGVGSQKLYFGGFNILPCNVNLSVAPARALTSTQASLEGSEAAALHAAVRKGDLLVGGGTLGVTIGHKNKTAVSVVRGVFKSIVVDALLRCEAACLNFSGVYLRNHISTGPQLKTFLGAHYMESLKSNVPALLGSMAALGNPLGLIRGLGDGMSDFVSEPVKGLRKSMEELDPSYVVGGVARGTKSLARHAVGGFAGSASLLTETFSKNMAVITLDRRYAQRRDRRNTLRSPDRDFAVTFFEGVESGAVKLVRGVWDGVTGVVRAPLRGAERHGMEGFAKGVGKGLLGLLVKPMIGLSDAATDVMIGVQGSVEGKSSLLRGSRHAQVRPRRPMYGRDRILRPYSVADAAAATLMLRTKLAGENYLSHCDMDDKVALLSVKRVLVLGSNGQEILLLKYTNIEKVSVQPMTREDGYEEWAVVIVLSFPRSNERPVKVIKCKSKAVAVELCSQLNCGVSLVNES